jgi:hypothetical protein
VVEEAAGELTEDPQDPEEDIVRTRLAVYLALINLTGDFIPPGLWEPIRAAAQRLMTEHFDRKAKKGLKPGTDVFTGLKFNEKKDPNQDGAGGGDGGDGNGNAAVGGGLAV